MALGCSVPNAIRLVDLAIAGDGLDWPAAPCRPWLSRQATGSTQGQLKYLPSRRTRGFPTSANFESKLTVRALMWSANYVLSVCVSVALFIQPANAYAIYCIVRHLWPTQLYHIFLTIL